MELRRHTDSDGDVLSTDGIRHAVEIGAGLQGDYDVAISSGAQRATQTIACFLAGMGRPLARGVRVDERFRSDVEERWKDAYGRAGAGDIESFRRVDADLVEQESAAFGRALADVFASLQDGERALIVGHSPMQEAAVYGLTGEMIEPLSKGAGVIVSTQDDDSYEVRVLEQ
ncbi:MAG: histidine phosphatase family protein [Actinomycetota bacterium]|nr:histidine phosphatase family protein [Actinomycetota bacterium]